MDKNLLNVTTCYWVNIKGKLQYECKAKAFDSRKYTFTVDSKEHLPSENAKVIVSKQEWDRIKNEMNKLITEKYNIIVKVVNEINNLIRENEKTNAKSD